jgi:Fe-S-cluster-containing dehydrogenase component
MAGNEQKLPDELSTMEQVSQFVNKDISRRSFLGTVGVAGLGAVAFQFGCSSSTPATTTTARVVFVPNALGMVVADVNKCVGCRRCEAACVSFNDQPNSATAKVQPSISNIKVNRNLLYGPLYNGATAIGQTGDGLYGNFKSTPDTCRQCPHPVTCMLVCPHGAIQVDPTVNAVTPNTYTVAAFPVNPNGATGGSTNANLPATVATIAYPGMVGSMNITDGTTGSVTETGPTELIGTQTGAMGVAGTIQVYGANSSQSTVTLPNAAYPQAKFLSFSNFSDGQPLNARVVNTDVCVGCGLCVEGCPWAMPSLDGPVKGATTKSHKCTLCGGSPECVAACVVGALTYVAWEDRLTTVDQRQANDIPFASDVIDTCSECH